MKRFIGYAVLALSTLISLFAISFSCDNVMKYNRLSAVSANKISSLQERVEDIESEISCFAVLKEFDGIIGIYDEKEKILLGTINTAVKTLPEADRKKLRKGIRVSNAIELIALFEDYSS